MAGSMWSSNGSGVGKNSSGGRDEMVMLYAWSSLSPQSQPDLGDRMKLAIATLKSGDDWNMCTARDVKALTRTTEMVMADAELSRIQPSNSGDKQRTGGIVTACPLRDPLPTVSGIINCMFVRRVRGVYRTDVTVRG